MYSDNSGASHRQTQIQFELSHTTELSMMANELCDILNTALGNESGSNQPEATVAHWRANALEFHQRLIHRGWSERDADDATLENARMADMLERIRFLNRVDGLTIESGSRCAGWLAVDNTN